MSRRGGQDHAPIVEAIGRHPTGLHGWSTHTAIVNAIQHRAGGGGNLRNLLVFATYHPTDACIGMMKTHGLNSVTYYDGAKRYIDIRNNANVANMNPGNIPATQNPNRIRVANNLMPQPGLLANPSANLMGQTAQAYLNNLAQNASAQLNSWIASWNVLAQVAGAGPRRIANIQQYLVVGGGFTQGFVDTVFMLFTYTVAGRVQWPGDQVGARIVGVLANPRGQIYGWQVNQRHINTTYHAETNLVQALGQIPAGTTLYTTLEPCHQCAGLFVRAGGNRCVFAQNDPNMTNNTALNNMSQRLNRATFIEDLRLTPVTVGARLDQIRDRATVAAQAAAVARRFNQNVGDHRLQNALATSNYQAIQTRVLNILNTTPTLDVFRQSDRMLRALVGVIRNRHPLGHPRRTLIENIAQALNY